MCCRAATRSWCWKAAGSRSAGARCRGAARLRDRSARRATGGAPCGPAAVEARLRRDTAGQHQGDPRGAHRHRLGRRQRHRGDRQGDPCGARTMRLFMVDAVASLGCVPFEMDAWGVDVAMAGSQKGLMTPPGLSFVAAVTARRAARTSGPGCARPYWDWTARDGKVHYQKYAGTPPEHLLFAPAPGPRHDPGRRARQCVPPPSPARRSGPPRRRGMGGRQGASTSTSTQPAERSDTVTTIAMADGRDPRPLLAYCNEKCGVVLGQGIGELARQVRSASPIWGTSTPRWCWARSACRNGARRARHPAPQRRRPGRYRLARRKRETVMSQGQRLGCSSTNFQESCAAAKAPKIVRDKRTKLPLRFVTSTD